MKSFKDIIKEDISTTFINTDEFSDIHNIDGRDMPVQIDDNEIIEREKKANSNMDGVYVKQKLIYVKADDFGALPAIGRQIMLDGKRYLVVDSTDEYGVYTITLEGNRSK
nr:MAG TPA: ATP-binding sugar transporter [Caudoviricetes sp.]